MGKIWGSGLLGASIGLLPASCMPLREVDRPLWSLCSLCFYLSLSADAPPGQAILILRVRQSSLAVCLSTARAFTLLRRVLAEVWLRGFAS